MCGISGFTHKIPVLEAKKRLMTMLGTIPYRGPDEQTGIVGHNYALGTVRLAIVDINGGHQPATSADKQVSVVFNGEIFNYKALRADLISKGAIFNTESEIETLLQLYLSQGIEMVKKLNGQFAIAIYDRRNNSLHLARDPFGIRPLFWKQHQTGIVFGSEIKTLAAFEGHAFDIDRESLLQTLRFWTVTGDRTAFTGVKQIPPGFYLTFINGEISHRRFWTLPSTRTVEPLKLRTDEDYFDAFRIEFRAAVERQRMADVKVACYVSGGIDSSATTACLAGIVGRDNLETFSIAFSDAEYDESKSQQALVRHLGVRNQTVRLGNKEIATAFPEVVHHAETPLFRTAPAPLFYLSKRVHENGIKVVMTGEGADEILLGYDLFRETKIRRFWSRRPESAWRGQLFRSLYQYLPQYRNKRYFNLLLDFYRGTLLPEDSSQASHYAMAVRWANGKALESTLSEGMRALADCYDPVSDLNHWLPSEYAEMSDIEKAQHIELMTLLPNYLLSSQGDRMSLANSVEGRYPYLDLEFVKFAASLPTRIKLRGLRDKFVLRQSFANQLPNELANRPKFAYQAPEMKSFFNNGRLIDYAADLLSEESVRKLGIFDPQAVARLIGLGGAGNNSRMGFRDNMAFVVMLSTSILHQQSTQWHLPKLTSPIHSMNINIQD